MALQVLYLFDHLDDRVFDLWDVLLLEQTEVTLKLSNTKPRLTFLLLPFSLIVHLSCDVKVTIAFLLVIFATDSSSLFFPLLIVVLLFQLDDSDVTVLLEEVLGVTAL